MFGRSERNLRVAVYIQPYLAHELDHANEIFGECSYTVTLTTTTFMTGIGILLLD